MKILTGVLIVVAVIIAIPLITALFVSNDYEVMREITINKPKQEVFNYVKQLRNQDNYSVWVRKDPNMKKDFRGNDGTEGFVYAWDGNNDAGKGEQEITNLVEGERVDVEVRFERPMEGKADAPMVTEAVSENETRVRWGMKGRSAYPMNIMNLFVDKVLGKDIDQSLANLKGVLEGSVAQK